MTCTHNRKTFDSTTHQWVCNRCGEAVSVSKPIPEKAPAGYVH